jgi:lipoate-protein ligase A
VCPLTVWWDDPADGPANMAADECLAAEAERRRSPLVRIYGWSATTVSLGAFQRLSDAGAVPEIAGMPLVRRPSGGGAIVHGGDLTYAAAVPRSHPWGGAPETLYDALHEAMAEVLAGRGLAARRWAAGDPAPTDAAAGGEPFFCFDRRSPGDLIVPGAGPAGPVPPKVMGSAQRRLATVVLQHGSLLLRHGTDVTGAARHPSLAELRPTAFGDATPRALAEDWLARLAARLGSVLVAEPLPYWRGGAAELAERAGRFRDDRWTARR